MIEDDKLRKMINEAIQNYLNNNECNLLMEMAFERKAYKDKVDHIIPQIIVNWCLIYYAKVTQTKTTTINHWKTELKAHLKTIVRMKPKDKSWKQKVLMEIWEENEYSDIEVIDYVVSTTFQTEHIDTSTDVYYETLQMFVSQSDDIIRLLYSCNNKTEIDTYVNNL